MPEEGSERELEEFLAGTGVLSQRKPEPEPEEPTGEVIHDEPPGYEPPPADDAPAPPPSPAPEPSTETEEEPVEEEVAEGEPHLIWARKKYGTDPEKWAKAAYDQERFISQLSDEKKQAEEVAQRAIEYAEEVETQASSRMSSTMPMSAAEEQWVEESMQNPGAYAYQAARNGNVQLYNAVLEQVAIENPGLAVQIGTQVQMALREEQMRLQAEQAERNGHSQPADFNADMGASFQRVGIDVNRYGKQMWEKFEELGEYHPYTLAVLGGDAMQRDLAVSAVYDLVRAGTATAQRIPDEQREAQIAREQELRRNAAGVVTGSPHVTPPKQDPFFAGMEAEWKRRGQWYDEES